MVIINYIHPNSSHGKYNWTLNNLYSKISVHFIIKIVRFLSHFSICKIPILTIYFVAGNEPSVWYEFNAYQYVWSVYIYIYPNAWSNICNKLLNRIHYSTFIFQIKMKCVNYRSLVEDLLLKWQWCYFTISPFPDFKWKKDDLVN